MCFYKILIQIIVIFLLFIYLILILNIYLSLLIKDIIKIKDIKKLNNKYFFL